MENGAEYSPYKNWMSRRDLNDDNICFVCGHYGESSRHIFFECRFSKVVWQLSSLEIMQAGFVLMENPIVGTIFSDFCRRP